MSIELPPIPTQPTADSTPEQWTHYRWAVSMHITAEQTAAIEAQTAQMVLQTAAIKETAAIGQQLADQPQQTGFSEDFVKWLVTTVMDKPEPASGG